MSVRFLYFDLGNVLLLFDRQKGVRQMAEVAGVSADVVQSAVFESDLSRRYELGAISSREFYEEFCERTQTRPQNRLESHWPRPESNTRPLEWDQNQPL